MPFCVVGALFAQAASPRAIFLCQKTQVGDMTIIKSNSLLHVCAGFGEKAGEAGFGPYIFLARDSRVDGHFRD